MASRKLEPLNAFTAALNKEQRQRLPEISWSFLAIDNSLREDDIHNLKPKHIKDYAMDLVNSDVGRALWPLSKLNTWDFSQPQDEVAAYVAGVMTKEIKLRKKSPQYLVDHVPRNVANRPSKPSTKAKKPTQQVDTTSSAAPKSKFIQKPVPIMSPNQMGLNKTPSTIVADTIECAGIRFSAPSNTSPSVAGKSTLPQDKALLEMSSADSQQIDVRNKRLGPASSPAASELVAQDHLREIASQAPQTTKDLYGTPIVGQKRQSERDDEDDVLIKEAPSSDEVRRKRVATNNSFSSPGSRQEEKELMNSPQQGSRNLGNPTESEARSSVANASEPTSLGDKEMLVLASGIQFTVENLAKLPDLLLDYLDKCQKQSIRSAESNTNQQNRLYHRNRAIFFKDIRSDLESRIKYLATNSDPDDNMIWSRCLWASENPELVLWFS